MALANAYKSIEKFVDEQYRSGKFRIIKNFNSKGINATNGPITSQLHIWKELSIMGNVVVVDSNNTPDLE